MTADILARYSTDHQNPVTIDVQVAACKAWCKQHGYQVGRVFADEAVSGMKDTRAGYQACIRHLSMGGADLVVIYDQSRMFREFTEWFEFRRLVASFGAGVASVTQPQLGGDLQDPAVFIGGNPAKDHRGAALPCPQRKDHRRPPGAGVRHRPGQTLYYK